MNIYKVIFAKNVVLSCDRLEDNVDSFGHYQYVHDKGQLIFAIIKADNESEAKLVAQQIIKEVKAHASENGFVSS